MKKEWIAITVMVIGFFRSGEAAPIFSDTSPLQAMLNNMTVGPSSHLSQVSVGIDYSAQDSIWANRTASSLCTAILQLTAPAGGSSSFGVYDPTDPTKMVQLMGSGASSGSQALLSVQSNGRVFVNFANSGVVFATNRFGFYYRYGTTTFYSQDSLNADLADHMAAYEGKGDVISIPPHPSGLWSTGEFLLACEQGSVPGDYVDFALLVENVSPIILCDYSLAPTNAVISGAGGSGSINVTAPVGCVWTAASADSFITLTSPTNGAGPGVMHYTLATNLTGSPRTGTVVIAGQTFTLAQSYASVGDGIPDWWRTHFFGGSGVITNGVSTAGADPDEDGFSNSEEWLLGTNPTNHASRLSFHSVTPQGNDLRIAWRAGGGRTNRVQSATSVTGPYMDVSSNIFLDGTGDVLTNWSDSGTLTNPSPRFYRIRLGP